MLEIFLGGSGQLDIFCSVNINSKLLQFCDDVIIGFIRKVQGLGFTVCSIHDSFGQLNSAFSALDETIADSKTNAFFCAASANDFNFFIRIRCEVIETDDNFRSEVFEIVDVGIQIAQAFL